jgi:hypothetical protein
MSTFSITGAGSNTVLLTAHDSDGNVSIVFMNSEEAKRLAHALQVAAADPERNGDLQLVTSER